MTTYTRQDYLGRKCTHRQYYAQFVGARERQLVSFRFGVDYLKAALVKDEHLNVIPLSSWDRLSLQVDRHADMRAAGDYQTLASAVCILKEAARQVCEQEADDDEDTDN